MQRKTDFRFFDKAPIDTVASDLLVQIATIIYKSVEIPQDMKAGKNLKETREIMLTRRCLGKLLFAQYKSDLMMYGFTTEIQDTKGSGETLTKHIIGAGGRAFPKGISITKILYADPDGAFRIRFTLDTMLVFYNHYLQQVYYAAQGTLRFEDVSPTVGVWVDVSEPRIDLFTLLEKFYIEQGEYQATFLLNQSAYSYKKDKYTWYDDENNIVVNGTLWGAMIVYDHKIFRLVNDTTEVHKLQIRIRHSVTTVLHSFSNVDARIELHESNGAYQRIFPHVEFARMQFPKLQLDTLDYLMNDTISLFKYRLPTKEKLEKSIQAFRGMVIDIPPVSVRYVGLDTKLHERIINTPGLVDELATLQGKWEKLESTIIGLSDDPPLAYYTLWEGIAKCTSEGLATYLTKEYFSCTDTERMTLDKIAVYFAPALYVYSARKSGTREFPGYTTPPTVTYTDYVLDMHRGSHIPENEIADEDVCIVDYLGDDIPERIGKLLWKIDGKQSGVETSSISPGLAEEAVFVWWDQKSGSYKNFRIAPPTRGATGWTIALATTRINTTITEVKLTYGNGTEMKLLISSLECYIVRRLPIMYIPKERDTAYRHVELRTYYRIK